MRSARCAARSSFCSMRRPKPVRPEVLPAHPELEGAPAPRALEGQLVPVERILLVVRRAVVLGPPVERLLQVGPAPDQEPADVVGLEEPLVGVDRDRVGPGEVGDARPVAAREERRAAVGRVDVEPEPVACGHVGQLPGGVDASRVGASDHAADGKWSQAGREVGLDLGRHRGAAQPEALVGRHDGQGVGREAQEVERLGDREVGLVGRVDAPALESGRARRWRVGAQAGGGHRVGVERGRGRQAGGGDLAEARGVDLAGDEQAHDVRHRPAGRQDPEALRGAAGVLTREADEVAEPANDLFLDEGAGRAAGPDVDALVGPLGQDLAGDREGQRRRREIGERARVVGIQHVRREPLAELREDCGRGGRRNGGGGGPAAARREELLAQARVGHGRDAAPDALVVEVVERRPPRRLAETLQGGAGGRLVAERDQLRLGVPAACSERIVGGGAGGARGIVRGRHRGEG